MIKILIVEDNKLDQKAVLRVLDEQGGYHVTVAGALKEAREKLRETAFDLVLLDACLPDGSTSELFDELKGTPFVVTAGAGGEEYAVSAYKAGASDYLIKDVERFYLKLIPSTIMKALKQKELAQLKADFVGTVSHELRTPLTVLGLGLENLQAGIMGPLNQKQAEVIARNIHNAQHLGKLIDNLLDLSRLQSGRTKLDSQELDLTQLIHGVVQNFQTTETAGNGLLREELPQNLPRLHCDPDLIAQVVTNLLSNAIRYAKEKIVVKAVVVNGFIQISVANDGPVIPPGKSPQLFEKFVQLDRANRKGTYKGTGLGLAISKEIIAQHKGKIWVESAGEKGVVFYFTLPV